MLRGGDRRSIGRSDVTGFRRPRDRRRRANHRQPLAANDFGSAALRGRSGPRSFRFRRRLRWHSRAAEQVTRSPVIQAAQTYAQQNASTQKQDYRYDDVLGWLGILAHHFLRVDLRHLSSCGASAVATDCCHELGSAAIQRGRDATRPSSKGSSTSVGTRRQVAKAVPSQPCRGSSRQIDQQVGTASGQNQASRNGARSSCFDKLLSKDFSAPRCVGVVRTPNERRARHPTSSAFK